MSFSAIYMKWLSTMSNHNEYVIERTKPSLLSITTLFKYRFHFNCNIKMAVSSGTVPTVSPSQILNVSPSLPTNKLLDNLTVSRMYAQNHFYRINLEKSKTFTVITTKLRETSLFYESIQNTLGRFLLFTWTTWCATLCCDLSRRHCSHLGT